ncbi:DMT family transporter [Actinacidiphila sp. bgisy167]|uniref:DMT family transporter n=1 Tax=Actinacidiphila sp. bgisy167 TaxID=3413797 RepID=UPI003D73727C
MAVLTVVLALLAALANGAASALQRRAALQQEEQEGDVHGVRGRLLRLLTLVRRPFWVAGMSALAVSGILQASALAVGQLSVVQPLMATELLFTLMAGSLAFSRRPDAGTWVWFLALAGGLALFLGAATPSGGLAEAVPGGWLRAGVPLALLVLVLWLVGRALKDGARACVLGCATAACFACTAALIKDVTGRFPDGLSRVFASWQLYALGAVGLLSVLVLQVTLRAGSLAASQPAMTIGDAVVSVALGWVLFEERIELGAHIVPEAAGVALMAVGAVGLSRSPAVAGGWDVPRGHRRGTSDDRPRTVRGGPG